MAGGKVTFHLAFPTDLRPPTVRSRENCPWAPLASCVSQSHGSPCPSPSPQGHGGSEKDNPQESRAGSEARAGPRSRQPHAPSVPPTAPPPPIADTLAGGNGHTWQQVRFVLSILQRRRGRRGGLLRAFQMDINTATGRPHSLAGGVLSGELESMHSHRKTEMK